MHGNQWDAIGSQSMDLFINLICITALMKNKIEKGIFEI